MILQVSLLCDVSIETTSQQFEYLEKVRPKTKGKLKYMPYNYSNSQELSDISEDEDIDNTNLFPIDNESLNLDNTQTDVDIIIGKAG